MQGKVVNSSGGPVKGATVYVEGTRIGTAADSKGIFKLKIPEKCIIRFTSVGFNELKVDIDGNTYVNIVLHQTNRQKRLIFQNLNPSPNSRQKQGRNYEIIDDEYLSFLSMDDVYSLQDLIGIT